MLQVHVDQGDEWGDEQSPQVRADRDSVPCTYRGKQSCQSQGRVMVYWFSKLYRVANIYFNFSLKLVRAT